MNSSTLAISCGPIVTTWDFSISNEENSVKKHRPHGDSTVASMSLSHNGQVLATCSSSSDVNKDSPNVALTLADSMTTIESFSNFHTSKSSSKTPIYTDTSPATSISFGGQAARSRYLCVSDAGGAVSIWDMKKHSRSRCFRLSSPNKTDTMHQLCSQACMDPTDKVVAALCGASSPSVRLKLFSLREKKATLKPAVTLEDEVDGHFYGGADCFKFSSVKTNQVMVGARDGTLLLWDILSPSSPSLMTLKERHNEAVTDLSFLPLSQALVASCSMDKTIVFHDYNSSKIVEVIRPQVGLQSLAFNADGSCLAVGTECGLVYVYDMRQVGIGPLCEMDVSIEGTPSYSVKSLHFSSSTGSSSNAQGPKKFQTDETIPSLGVKATPTSESTLTPSCHQNETETKYIAPTPDSSNLVRDLFVTKEIDSASQQSQLNSQTFSERKLFTRQTDTSPQQTLSFTNTDSRLRRGLTSENKSSQKNFGHVIQTMNGIIKKKEFLTESSLAKADEALFDDLEYMKIKKNELKKIVEDSVEVLREDIEESIRNLHCDCLRQFQSQSEEMTIMFEKQRNEIAQLLKNNLALEEENRKLRCYQDS